MIQTTTVMFHCPKDDGKNQKLLTEKKRMMKSSSAVVLFMMMICRVSPPTANGFILSSSSSSLSCVLTRRHSMNLRNTNPSCSTTVMMKHHTSNMERNMMTTRTRDESKEQEEDKVVMKNWIDQFSSDVGEKMKRCAAVTTTTVVMMMMMMGGILGGGDVSPCWATDYGSMPLENRAVAEAWRIVDNNYLERTFNGQDWFGMRQSIVTKAKYKTMDDANAAIDKMVSSLGDKYTRYLSPAKYISIVNAATGTLAGGIGVELSADAKTNMVYASDIQPNSPAEQAGVLTGDIFIQVDGLQVDDGKATPDDVAARLRGPEGSRVGLTILRNSKNQDFILTRQPITVASIKSYISPSHKNVGVIKIKVFSGTTAEKVKESLLDLKKQGATSIVLDLRNNVGGLLPGGVETASLFLEKDLPVVFVVDKKGVIDAQSTFAQGLDTTDPLVLVVNENTASAAEVLTAALLENNRAIAVGKQTFGKGIVQTIRQLNFDNGGVAVTVARYETPLHHDINKQGIPVSSPLINSAADDDTNNCESKNKNDIVACIPPTAFQSPPIQQ